jgi:hypothetical protein
VQLITLIKPSQCLVFQLLSHILLQKSNTAKSLHFYYIINILFLNICTNLWYNKNKKNYNLFSGRVKFIILKNINYLNLRNFILKPSSQPLLLLPRVEWLFTFLIHLQTIYPIKLAIKLANILSKKLSILPTSFH